MGFGGRTGTQRQDQAPFLLMFPVASKALGPGRLPGCPSGKGAAHVQVETRPAHSRRDETATSTERRVPKKKKIYAHMPLAGRVMTPSHT